MSSISTMSGGYLRKVPRWTQPLRSTNVGQVERILSMLSGVVLIARAFRQRSSWDTLAAAAGGALIERGLTGKCALYTALAITSAERRNRRVRAPSAPQSRVAEEPGQPLPAR
jgi:uncharacterized membrane protein